MSNELIDAKPFQCSSCWRFENVPDRRYKPCEDKGKTATDKPCKEFQAVGPATCGDCFRFKRKYKGKTCQGRGKAVSDQACDEFLPKIGGISVATGEPIHLFNGKYTSMIRMKEGTALSLIVGDAILIVESVGDDTFRVLPTRMHKKAGRPSLRVYGKGKDKRIGWKTGDAEIVTVDGNVVGGDEDAYVAVLKSPPAPKPRKKAKPKPKLKPKASKKAKPKNAKKATKEQIKQIQKDQADYRPPAYVLDDLPALKASINDSKMEPGKAVIRIVKRYAKSQGRLDIRAEEWLINELEAFLKKARA